MKARKPKEPNPVRDEWKCSYGDHCFEPGCKASIRRGDVLECHECVGGSDRHKTVRMPEFWLALCQTHHEPLGSRPNQESLVRQLAVKLFADPLHYNATAVVKMWRPNCTADFVLEIISAVQVEHARLIREYR